MLDFIYSKQRRNQMGPFVYMRALRHADHTVFCVQEGQKFYYDPQYGVKVPFSSGQQVKRSILESVLMQMGETPAPITFNYNISTKKSEISQKTTMGEGEPWSPCNPQFTDQLLGGWMRAAKADFVIKRRSPLSISAMRPLHPLLGNISTENITFDRSSHPEIHPVRVVDSNGDELSADEISHFLTSKQRTLPRRKWVPNQIRASGLFVYDVAIDLRTLFSVSLNQEEPELNKDTIENLKNSGWTESRNTFGACLVCPGEKRGKIIKALANGLIDWRITSNQSRTFSLMETLAVAISSNANNIAGAIRAELKEESSRPAAAPILDESAGAMIYKALPISGFITGEKGSDEALQDASNDIKSRLQGYEYDNPDGK